MTEYRDLANAFRLGQKLTGDQLGRLHVLATAAMNYRLASQVAEVQAVREAQALSRESFESLRDDAGPGGIYGR